MKRKSQFLYSLFTIIVGLLSFGHFYGFGDSGVKEAGRDELKVMSFNTRGFNKNGWMNGYGVGDSIISFIKKQDADILVIQEHSRARFEQLRQYPYRSESPISNHRATQAIFSKYPIVGEGSLDLPRTNNNIIYVDIVFKNDTIRVYNAHFQSFRIIPSSDNFSDSKKSEKTLRRLVGTFAKQLEQAQIFRSHYDKSPHVNLVCGDFNNTQFSNIYKIVRGEMVDTFLETGSGFGGTYELWKIPLRIDYILADPEFEVLSHQNFDVKLSDHYPIMATLRLPSHE
ncbi:endonuclease/exonuclease/phosphatase family protein [Flagellimonas zhangzhouensis]|uniref:endonuclease/exonuclease/phosphatase family protein n=1 Tax=Flagellimonas zhangzhouensis TaxID=1073328 RepID=UPI0011131694|nr:endonuclease/exonuclease/phosphatase family protein [Allomuricauda zhangzhouensis]